MNEVYIMPISINQSTPSFFSQRNIQQSQDSIQSSLEKLSSLIAINRASDNPSGLFISQGQTSDINALNQSVRNASDGISLTQTADGALSSVTQNIQRIRELAVQSANGTVEGREVLQLEADQLTQELSRTLGNTEFNGQKLFDGSSSELNFQVGSEGGSGNQIKVNLESLTGLNAFSSDENGKLTIDLSSQSTAQSAISSLDSDLDSVVKQRASFGASENRFSSSISTSQDRVFNLEESRSRILDTDLAKEASALVQAKIRNQAGISTLAQSNVSAQSVLSLLK
jgi:flagellin